MSRRLKNDSLHKLEKTKQIKKKSGRKKVKEGGKRREAPYCFEIVELSYERRCKALTI